MDTVGGPLHVCPGVAIPAEELTWRFSRSSGPGGQSVNTTDSRVEVRWDIDRTVALTEPQRERLKQRFAQRLVNGELRVVAAEHRSQWQNRRVALRRLADLIASGLAPDPRRRRASRPSRGSVERRLLSKRQRSQLKQRRRPPPEE
ncbi:MAG: alternative ribosome rescue aminoacyl-tRNA hydrolase ArfB [Candidatus Nanopelagicales bacterium]|nr:alternative ribosome rescue aminoacyl-tRNA hydrolase ArfB [Candidatus Nanopelagicales bacterium]